MIEEIPMCIGPIGSNVVVTDGAGFAPGDDIIIHLSEGEVHARILDCPTMWNLVITRKKLWRPVLFLYRIRRTWRLTGQYLIKVLEIWNLACVPVGTIPGRGCIKWPGRHKEDN